MLVNQILSIKNNAAVVTIKPTATVAEAVSLLSERRIGAVVVSENGSTPLGILSERDIVRELGRRGAEVLDSEIGTLMTRKLMTCTTGENALRVLERMTEGRFRHLPVVDENGEMLGLVSIGDAVSARLKEMTLESEALKNMIMGT